MDLLAINRQNNTAQVVDIEDNSTTTVYLDQEASKLEVSINIYIEMLIEQVYFKLGINGYEDIPELY